jgi:tetratricopeptide (TPR) repeat protein
LEIQLQHHNVWHSSIARAYFKIAGLLQAHGRNEDALTSYFKELELYRRVFGEKELFAAHMYNEIRNLLQQQPGKVDEAVDMYERAIGIKKIRLGEKHPSVAEPLH